MPNTHTLKQFLSISLLAGLYLLININFYNWSDSSILYKFSHLLRLIPFTAGLTLLTVAFINRQNNGRMSWPRILRIYFTLGILLGLFFGLYYFVSAPAA